MTLSERLDLIKQVLERQDSNEAIAFDILEISLSNLKACHLIVKTTPVGPMKTDIAVEIDGIEFKTCHFSYDTGNGIFNVQDDYSRPRFYLQERASRR